MKDVSLPTLANTREDGVKSVDPVQQFISSIGSGSVLADETMLIIEQFEKNDLESNENLNEC